jgi:BlaI family penicillinase repressor
MFVVPSLRTPFHNTRMKELTKAEEQVMQVLWEVEKGFIKDLIERLPEPRPAYTTVSTIIRILEKKTFVGHEAFGKTYQYFPLVSKEEYSRQAMNKMVSSYFGGSAQQLVSFFVKEKKLSLDEFNDILKVIKENGENEQNDKA